MKLRVLIPATLILAGCNPTYGDTLEQRLAGKTPEDRRAILAQECGKEIANSLRPTEPGKLQHAEDMKRICEESTGRPVYFDPRWLWPGLQ